MSIIFPDRGKRDFREMVHFLDYGGYGQTYKQRCTQTLPNHWIDETKSFPDIGKSETHSMLSDIIRAQDQASQFPRRRGKKNPQEDENIEWVCGVEKHR